MVKKAIYAIIKQYSLEELWDPPFIHGTSLTIVEMTGDKMDIILEADTSHLE